MRRTRIAFFLTLSGTWKKSYTWLLICTLFDIQVLRICTLANKMHFEACYIIKLKYRGRRATWSKAETPQQINQLYHRDFSFEIRQHMINILNMHKRTYSYFCFPWRVKTFYVLFKGQNYCLLLNTVSCTYLPLITYWRSRSQMTPPEKSSSFTALKSWLQDPVLKVLLLN